MIFLAVLPLLLVPGVWLLRDREMLAMLGNAQVGTINLAWRWLSGTDTTLVDVYSYGGVIWHMVSTVVQPACERIADRTEQSCFAAVLDATTGQNAHAQVETFKTMSPVDALVLTKLDGSAKGGVLVALAEKFKLPVVAIGVGEGINDLRPFEARSFARSLMGLPACAR